MISAIGKVNSRLGGSDAVQPIDGHRRLYSNASSVGALRLKKDAVAISTGKGDKSVPACCMVVGFQDANQKAMDVGLAQHELPFSMTEEQALKHWSDVGHDRRWPYVEFEVNGHNVPCQGLLWTHCSLPRLVICGLTWIVLRTASVT